MQAYGLAVLRLIVAVVFIAHGAQKLFGIWGGYGLAATGGFFEQVGLRPGYPLALLVAIVEFGGGVLLALGAVTMFVSLALALVMVGAVWKVHAAHGFFLASTPGQGNGIEYNLVLIGALVALMLAGPGAFSVDGRRARSAEAKAAGRARLRAGNV
jgi:putative oxidoreductase